jgi:L-alanine-DL-glutamate epimerase-like enolase superfamily enzyme
MKIMDVKAIPLFIPMKETPPLTVESKTRGYHVLVEVSTDEGITGYGEAWRLTPKAVCTLIEEGLKPLLVGKDPTQIEKLWDTMYSTTFRYGRKGIVIHAISGIEIALWDILGKYRGLPIYEMIGGLCREKIKAYASLHHYEKPKDVAAVALRCVEDGYTAIKLHQGDIESVKVVRQAIGTEVTLMVDAAGSSWSPRQALEKSKELEQYNVSWLEEPVWPADDYDGLASLQTQSNIKIAAGENEYTHYGFKEMISKHSVDIVQPDVTKSGGILECRKIFAMAEAWNLQIATHSFYYGPGVAATVHLGLSNIRSEWVEINSIPLETSIMHPSLRPENGYLSLPEKPGLGIEVDNTVIKKYLVA